MLSKRQREILTRDAQVLTLAQSKLKGTWDRRELSDTLNVSRFAAARYVRAWFYAGVIQKVPAKIGGYEGFQFISPK